MYIYDNTSEKIIVTNIEWERIFLKVEITSFFEEEVIFKMRSIDRRPLREREKSPDELDQVNYIFDEFPVLPIEKIDNRYTFLFNIAAFRGREFIDNGRWQIVACISNEEFNASVSNDVAYGFDDLSRVFRYDRGKYAYTISFATYQSDRGLLSFVIDSYFYIENKKWRKRKYIQEATTRPGKVKRFYMYWVVMGIRAYYHIFDRIFRKHGNNVLLMSETKPYLWGNLLYIDKRLKERGLDKKFNIAHSCRAAVGVHTSAFSWAKLVTLIARQDFIFVDDYVPIFGFFDLGKKTKLIQVWHAGVGFKSVGYSRFGKESSPFPAKSSHKKYDYVITGSEELVHVYEEVFGIEKDAFLPIGMARLDGYLDEDTICDFKNKFYNTYPNLKDKKIILFAPTYRGTDQKFAFYDYDNLDFDRIYDFCGDEWAFVLKMHPFVRVKPPIPQRYRDRIFDLSSFQNINDLYYITEILITDYSSAYFEFALMDKPVLFYTYDREQYELTRGVHKPIKETAPGRVCDTFEELMEALVTGEMEQEKTRAFAKKNFSHYDGKAADKIIDTILLGKEEKIDE